MEADKGESPASSAQIQSALDQLTYLGRIVHGDDEMSLSDLLASASASGPSSSVPVGGLSKALPALLAPLLSSGGFGANGYDYGSLSQQQALLAKQAAFQPRRYLVMTADLMARTSDITGEMHRATQLAKMLESRSDKDALKTVLQQKVLQDRRAKKAASDQHQLQADQAISMQDKQQSLQHNSLRFASSDASNSALSIHAKQMESSIETEPDEGALQSFLQAWHIALHTADGEASARILLASQQTFRNSKRRNHVLRMRISQTGYAWLWLHFEETSKDAWSARVDRVNVLAESEVEEFKSDAFQNISLESSRFPLYRHVTQLLHTKLTQINRDITPSWTHLTVALFAMSALCRLNELPMQTNFGSTIAGAPLRGQESILNALAHLDITMQAAPETTKTPHSVEPNQANEEAMTIEGPEPSPPSSALFSE